MERNESDGKETVWLFGRGASVACGLKWVVPPEWKSLPREECIGLIRKTLLEEMKVPTVDADPYRQLLAALGRRTATHSKHLFVTTNWDTLLDREVNSTCPTTCPSWLMDSHVFHLNGTVEDQRDNARRSYFLLESDLIDTRVARLESNKAFARMSWLDCFVVVGMSFECATDQSLLIALGKTSLPVEASRWLVVNPDKSALDDVCKHIQSRLPLASVTPILKDFASWICHGLPELRDLGVLRGGS